MGHANFKMDVENMLEAEDKLNDIIKLEGKAEL